MCEKLDARYLKNVHPVSVNDLRTNGPGVMNESRVVPRIWCELICVTGRSELSRWTYRFRV